MRAGRRSFHKAGVPREGGTTQRAVMDRLSCRNGNQAQTALFPPYGNSFTPGSTRTPQLTPGPPGVPFTVEEKWE